MDQKQLLFDISSEEEPVSEGSKEDDYDRLSEVLCGPDDFDEIVFISENNPSKRLKLSKCVEDDDECVVLDGDPDKPLEVSNDEGEEDGDELQIVGQKGEIACRDLPHSRHLCAKFKFSSTAHEKYCELCHCFVCDTRAPCLLWGSGISKIDHCHATDKEEIWGNLRKKFRHLKNSPNPVSTNVVSAMRAAAAAALAQLNYAPLCDNIRRVPYSTPSNQVSRLNVQNHVSRLIAQSQVLRPIAQNQVSKSVVPSQVSRSIAENQVSRPIAQNQVSRPISQIQVFRPMAHNQVSRPSTLNQFSRPGTLDQVLRPIGQNQVSTPIGQNRVSRPNAQNQISRPVAQSQVLMPIAPNHVSRNVSQNQVSRPIAANQIPRPIAHNQVSRPNTQYQMSRPIAQSQVSRPMAQIQLPRPIAQNQVSRPNTGNQIPRPSAQNQIPSSIMQNKVLTSIPQKQVSSPSLQNQVLRAITIPIGNSTTQNRNPRPPILRACASSTRSNTPSITRQPKGQCSTVIQEDQGCGNMTELVNDVMAAAAFNKSVSSESITTAAQHVQSSVAFSSAKKTNTIGCQNFGSGENQGPYMSQRSSQLDTRSAYASLETSIPAISSKPILQSKIFQRINQYGSYSLPTTNSFTDFDIGLINNSSHSHQQPSISNVQLQTAGFTSTHLPTTNKLDDCTRFQFEDKLRDIREFLLEDQPFPGVTDGRVPSEPA